MPTKDYGFYVDNGVLKFKYPELNTVAYEGELFINRYEILVPNKVIKVYFNDFLFGKMVCESDDKFDLRRGLYLALAKHLYKKELTVEGIEAKATEISYMKKYVNMVEKAIKEHDRLEKEKIESVQKQKKEKKAKHESRINRDKKKRERKIEIQKEAYLRAMREMGEFKDTKENK